MPKINVCSEPLDAATGEELYRVTHIRLPSEIRQKEIRCPEEYVRRYLTSVEVKYADYSDWWVIRVEDLLGDSGGGILSTACLIGLLESRRDKRAKKGIEAPTGWRAVGGAFCCDLVGARPLLDSAKSTAWSQSLTGVTGRYCVLRAAIDAVSLHSFSDADTLATLLSEDSGFKPHWRQYEDLQLVRNNASAQCRPSLAGLLNQTFERRLFELQCSKGKVVVGEGCRSPSEVLLAQAPGVYVAILQDNKGDHGHAVALDLRSAATAAILDASDTESRLPITDANLRRCCGGVQCVGCHRLGLIRHNPPKRKQTASVALSEGERAAKKRNVKAAQRKRKRSKKKFDHAEQESRKACTLATVDPKSENFYLMSGSRKWSIQLFSVVKHLLKRGSFSDSEVSQLSEQRLIAAVRCTWVSLDSLAAS